jgi:hypothetical protein
MSADLTKLTLHTGYPAFKNNRIYTGSFTISGTTSGGTNTRTATINLDEAPDLADIVFSGRSTETYTNRPNNYWFKQGTVEVRGDGGAFTDYATPWVITSRISGSSIIITATCVQTFTQVLTLTSSTVQYRVVDYSVF